MFLCSAPPLWGAKSTVILSEARNLATDTGNATGAHPTSERSYPHPDLLPDREKENNKEVVESRHIGIGYPMVGQAFLPVF